ncbi:MAG: hypothetical protein ACREMA_07275 [Longimicrobiales bacterium]
MSYPLALRFKKIAIARQLAVEDSSGQLMLYVKQKAFKLREAVTVFGDREQTRPLYQVNADRVIDFSATYDISDAGGASLGSIRQKGMQSLWRTRYDILRGGAVVFSVQEENPWAKMADGMLGEVPLLGLLTGYLFHPRYLITTADGRDVIRVVKQPAFFESLFQVSRLDTPLKAEDERLLLIGAVVTILLERRRG